jgi:inhibitor of cysteine peptidase
MRVGGGRALLATALLCAAGAASAAIQTVAIGDLYDGGTVNLAPGDTLEVRLAAGANGCAWSPAFGDPAVLKLESGPEPAPGVFRYKAVTTGSASVGLACLKATDPQAPPGGLFRVLAVVKESVLPRGLILEQPDSGSDIFLAQGDQLLVRLPANPSTGYSWVLAGNAPSVLRPVGEPKYEGPAKAMPGAGGTQTFEFRVVGGGGAFLDFVYRRPSEKDAPAARRWGVFVAAAAVGP